MNLKTMDDRCLMKFSWIPFESEIGELLKKILPKETVVPILGGRLKGKKWIVGSGVVEYALGSFEYETIKLFEKVVQNGSVVYDIGAHVGFYTLLASELVDENGKVIAFEPVSRNLWHLKKHLEMNNCANVIVIEAAVSDKGGVSSFNEGSDSSTGHLSKDGNLKVATVSIDELVTTGKIPPPNYMKIDVEGAEFLVLKGAKLTLTRYSPKIFLATHGRRLHTDCINFLVSLRYRLKPIVGNNLHITDKIFAYRKNDYARFKDEKGKPRLRA